MFRLSEKPQSLRHLISDTFGLFKEALVSNIAAVLLIALVVVIGMSIVAFLPGGKQLEQFALHHTRTINHMPSGLSIFLIVVMIFLAKIISSAMVKSNWNVGQGQPYQLKSTISEAFKKTIPLLFNIILFLVLLGVIIGLYVSQATALHGNSLSSIISTILSLAFFYCIFAYFLTIPALMIDHAGFKSLFVAFAAIRGNWWRTFSSCTLTTGITYLLVIGLPLLITMGILLPSALPHVLSAIAAGSKPITAQSSNALPHAYMLIIGTVYSVYIVAGIALVLSLPGVFSATLAVVYNDAKLRKSGNTHASSENASVAVQQ